MAPKQSTLKKRPSAAEDTDFVKARKCLLGWMRYMPKDASADDSEHADGSDSEIAVRSRAQKVYQALDDPGKASFIARWNSSTDKKKGTWMRDFEESLDKKKAFHREKRTTMLTRQFQERAPPCTMQTRRLNLLYLCQRG